MKLAGLVLIFAGVLALLKNVGVMMSWSLIWPIALIFVGMAVKHIGCRRCGMGGWRKGCWWGGSRGSCEGMECRGGVCEEMECEGGKCEEGECTECKK